MPASEVHNIDCLELMRTLPDKAFELAIADPPYGGAGNQQIEGGGRFGGIFDKYKRRRERTTQQEECSSDTKEEPG